MSLPLKRIQIVEEQKALHSLKERNTFLYQLLYNAYFVLLIKPYVILGTHLDFIFMNSATKQYIDIIYKMQHNQLIDLCFILLT